MTKPIISVKEARKILGKDAEKMSDEQIENTIETLDLLAKQALKQADEKRKSKKDAKQLAELTYDIYREKKEPQNE